MIMNMVYMNSMYFNQINNQFNVFLPNEYKIAEFRTPLDERQDLNFNTLDGITTLLSQRAGMLDLEMKALRKLKIPDMINIKTFENGYNIYMKGIHIAVVYLDNDVVSAKIVIGIANILYSRWNSFINGNNVRYSAIHTKLK